MSDEQWKAYTDNDGNLIVSMDEGHSVLVAVDGPCERCHDIQGRIAKVPEYEDELQFQTQMAKDTDEAAEYYRRLLLEARAERDAVNKYIEIIREWAVAIDGYDLELQETVEKQMYEIATNPDAPKPLEYIESALDAVTRQLEFFRNQFPTAARNWDRTQGIVDSIEETQVAIELGLIDID